MKTKFLTAGIILFLSTFALTVKAADWEHKYRVGSSNAGNVQIAVDYQTDDYTTNYQEIAEAMPVWVNLTGNFTGQEKVSVLVMEFSSEQNEGGSTSPSQQGNAQQYELKYEGNGRFSTTVAPQGLLRFTGHSNSNSGQITYYFYEMAFVITDGAKTYWLRNNGTPAFSGNPSNFSFDFNQAASDK